MCIYSGGVDIEFNSVAETKLLTIWKKNQNWKYSVSIHKYKNN